MVPRDVALVEERAIDGADERFEMVENVPTLRPCADALDPLVDGELDAVVAELLAPRVEERGFGIGDEAVEVEDDRLQRAYLFSSVAFSTSSLIGIRNQKVEPLPTSDSAQIWPMWTCSTRCLTRKRPRPVP
jgi:hypothetical protein